MPQSQNEGLNPQDHCGVFREIFDAIQLLFLMKVLNVLDMETACLNKVKNLHSTSTAGMLSAEMLEHSTA